MPITNSFLYCLFVNLHCHGDAIIHCHRQRLSAAHFAPTCRQDNSSSERSVKVFLSNGGDRFVRALKDPLRSNERPRTCRHLSVHYEPLLLELVEMSPGSPLPSSHAVNGQYSGSQDVA